MFTTSHILIEYLKQKEIDWFWHYFNYYVQLIFLLFLCVY